MLKSVTFEVIGEQQLHCEGCEQRVERMLKALPGVERIRAQARKQRIEVLYDASIQEARAIAEHLGTAGYQTNVGVSQP
jgi:copper chaperone